MVYMEYQGIKGNVTAAGYEGMIALDFYTLGVDREISMISGAMANRESSAPHFSVVVTGKRLDGASPGLLREAVAGAGGKQVILHFVRTGKKGLQEYMTYTFEGCLPVHFGTLDTRSETSAAVERLYLSYTSVMLSYFERGADNKIVSVHRYGYDLALAKSL